MRAKANEIYAQVVKENGLVNWANKNNSKLDYSEFLSLEEVSKWIFSTEAAKKILKGVKGDFFSPIESEKALYLIEILDKKPKRNLSFLEAKDQVKKDFLKERGRDICEEKIKKFVEQGKKQKDYSNLAREFAFRINKVEIQRKNLPQELFNSLTHSGLVEKPYFTDKEVKLINLIKINPVNRELSQEELNFATEALMKYKEESILSNLFKSYQKRVKIKIYPLFQKI